MDMPAAAIARVRMTVTVNSLPGVVVTNANTRRSRREGPANVDMASSVALDCAGLAGAVTSSNQWSLEATRTWPESGASCGPSSGPVRGV